MNVAVRYYTRGGNTKKLAEAVAIEAGVKALPITEPLTEDVDALFLASSVYAIGIAKEVKDFIEAIDVKVGEVVNISTAAIIESTYDMVKTCVEKKGIKMSNQDYHCRGQFTLMHRGRPNTKDLQGASDFTKIYLDR